MFPIKKIPHSFLMFYVTTNNKNDKLITYKQYNRVGKNIILKDIEIIKITKEKNMQNLVSNIVNLTKIDNIIGTNLDKKQIISLEKIYGENDRWKIDLYSKIQGKYTKIGNKSESLKICIGHIYNGFSKLKWSSV